MAIAAWVRSNDAMIWILFRDGGLYTFPDQYGALSTSLIDGTGALGLRFNPVRPPEKAQSGVTYFKGGTVPPEAVQFYPFQE